MHIARAKKNGGYAGSEKIAYRLVRASPSIHWMIVLHADGQYPPALLEQFLQCTDENTAMVYGVRSKRTFGKQEETPGITYFFIKALSLLESAITGCWCREWHTGYVMYNRTLIEAVDLDRLTATQHIDGHMMFLAHKFGMPIKSLNIYKRYKDFQKFGGWGRIRYVLQVFKLMLQFRFTKKLPPQGNASNLEYDWM